MTTDKSKKDISYLPRAWGTPGQREKNLKEDSAEPSSLPPAEDTAQAQKMCQVAGPEVSCQCPCSSGVDDESDSPEFDGTLHDDPLGPDAADLLDQVAERPDQTETAKVRVRIVGIRFGYACKVYHFDCGEMDLSAGDSVVVKTEKGMGLGLVALEPFDRELNQTQLEGLRKVLRKATREDFDQKARCRSKEEEAYAYCLERIDTLQLPMKLVTVECFFDCSKYVFYFTSEGRVDFRELVKQLVARFPVRIEMRQIGVRHEAKMTGGLACCGQELCCARFLTDFRPVSVKMAKTQNLSLNPSKISGVCGRLMCCLAYEHDVYEEFKKGLPRVGKAVTTSKGEGTVLKHNPLAETVFIKLPDDSTVEVGKHDVVGDQRPASPVKDGENDKSRQKKGRAQKVDNGEFGPEDGW